MTPSEPVVTVENRVLDGEGRLRWMEFVNRGFYDPDGRLVEFQSIGRDITLRKEGEVERRAPSGACRSASASRASGCSPAAWPTTSTMS
jgi:hypothetical protein